MLDTKLDGCTVLLPITTWAEAVRAQLHAQEVNTRSAWNEAALAWVTLYYKAEGLPKDQRVYQCLYRAAKRNALTRKSS